MSASATSATGGRDIKGLAVAQRLGRSLMLPIAALPAAGLLMRLGADDMLGQFAPLKKVAAVMAAAGGSLFNWLPLLFAVGVAVGFARKGDGSTGLAAAVGFVVFTQVVQVFAPVDPKNALNPTKWPYGVLAGIIVGIVTALLWQRFHRTKLPPYLAFFGGRRFVPIINAFVLMLLGVVFGLIYPWFNQGLTAVGDAVTGSTIVGAFLYGVLNRLLIPLGLHHIINNVVWFQFGEFEGKTGDINRFLAGDPTAGTFQTGFFPIFMFALPAAALAIWQTARPSQKKIVGGIMGSAALTAFITGVTEPLEFAFMFVAWPLYLIHALLTGTSHAITNALGIHDGFSFSAGAIDYLLNFGIATSPLLLIPIGLVYAVVYYFLFRWVITKWNLKTPGREDDATPEAEASKPTADKGTTGKGTAGSGAAPEDGGAAADKSDADKATTSKTGDAAPA
ncbi:PTS transporter subunit EIIC [Goodfellowiella coeruleoviolacea]|uniref:PTS system, N-acetylglucosamine-specific IIC component n=1 Tax=Goodfellowiella coeruleoviolacea TaxID=334858 RepID=A0AAE3GIA6_9PSEU|nr:PTS transporter subunit EIIC [Goodfellowiella coeruleoviolacea]MCP2166663.1 PTS system, N-acetylglucosamine-specific IIC component [Goodfellowiella coeruleoviolacea]